MKTFPLLLSVLCALLIPHAAVAEVYRLSPDGDDTATGSAEKPWKTLAKAFASVQPGDTIELAAGSYEFTLPRKPFDGRMVTLRPAPDARGKVALTGRFYDTDGRCSYLRFEGLNIQSTVRFHKVRWTQFVRCTITGSSHWGVGLLDAEHCGLYGCKVATDTGSQCMMSALRHCQYRYNEVVGGSSDAFQGNGDDILIEGNWVHDMKQAPGAHADGIQLGNTRRLVVRANVFECPDMQTFFFAWTAKEKTYEDILVENNVCTTAQVHALTVNPSTNLTVRNNLFICSPASAYSTSNINTAGCSGKVVVQNNIFWLLGMKAREQDVASNNIYMKRKGGSWGPGMLGDFTTPEDTFVDRAAMDYRLKEGSPAVGGAAPGSYPARDVLGRERPAENACVGPIEKLPGDDKPFMDMWKAYFTRMQAEVQPPDPPAPET